MVPFSNRDSAVPFATQLGEDSAVPFATQLGEDSTVPSAPIIPKVAVAGSCGD
jgi:hypothetical protein